MYEKRKLTEFLWVGRLFGGCDYDRQGLSWIRLLAVPLPADRWRQNSSQLLIEIPNHYPEIPPSRFYLDRTLRDRRGRKPGHYFRYDDYSNRGWAWFCLHLENGWLARQRIEDGDNLLTVVERIQIGLAGNQRNGE